MELRAAVVDDNWWTREHMRARLDAAVGIRVVLTVDQDEAVALPVDAWDQVDVAIVDVYDDGAPMEVGTDLFSGIAVLERLRNLPVRTIAITPHRQHPLVEQRIFQARADFLYHRWELNSPDALEQAVLEPDPARRPQGISAHVLVRYGADLAQTNRAVRAYESSRLYGRLVERATFRTLKVPRRAVDAFTRAIRATSFYAPPQSGSATVARFKATWPNARDFVLVLIGRKDAPPSQTDDHEMLWIEARRPPQEP